MLKAAISLSEELNCYLTFLLMLMDILLCFPNERVLSLQLKKSKTKIKFLF